MSDVSLAAWTAAYQDPPDVHGHAWLNRVKHDLYEMDEKILTVFSIEACRMVDQSELSPVIHKLVEAVNQQMQVAHRVADACKDLLDMLAETGKSDMRPPWDTDSKTD
jgi:hypothetical protein